MSDLRTRLRRWLGITDLDTAVHDALRKARNAQNDANIVGNHLNLWDRITWTTIKSSDIAAMATKAAKLSTETAKIQAGVPQSAPLAGEPVPVPTAPLWGKAMIQDGAITNAHHQDETVSFFGPDGSETKVEVGLMRPRNNLTEPTMVRVDDEGRMAGVVPKGRTDEVDRMIEAAPETLQKYIERLERRPHL